MSPRGIFFCLSCMLLVYIVAGKDSGESPCPGSWFKCHNGRCVAPAYVCDNDNDCGDLSDEKNCNINPAETKFETCKAGEFQCSNKRRCISEMWMCDGQDDCDDSSDETEDLCKMIRTTVEPCSGFLCKNEDCLPLSWRCDGTEDCFDGSDEKHCPPKTGNSSNLVEDEIECSDPSLWKCTSGLGCLHLEHVCDGTPHCHDGSDEGPKCNTPQCSPTTCVGKECHPTPDRPRCYCREGYQLSGHSCTDINECQHAEEPVCSQICTNSDGGYSCSCHEGYDLQKDNKSCVASDPDPMLLFAAESEIRGIFLRANKYFPVHKGLHSAVGIDYDGLQSRVYWSEAVEGGEVLSSDPEGNDIRLIIAAGMNVPEDIAVDWLGRNLYITDSGYQHIVVCRLDGKYCKIIIADHKDKPRALALYAVKGLMFWTSWGNQGGIDCAGMDGSSKRTVVSKNIVWPNGLALDTTTDRLYWTDAKLRHVETARLDGSDRRVVLSSIVQHPFSIAVFEDTLFWTDWARFSLESCNKFTGKGHTQLVKESAVKPMGIHIYHPLLQPLGVNPCWGHTCRHICLLTPHNEKSCTCAEGYKLKADGFGCERLLNVSRVLVSTSSALYDVVPTSIGRGPTQLLQFEAGAMMAALAYSNQRRLLYLSSLQDGDIETISLDDLQLKHVITSTSEVIESLALDPSSGAIYWLDTERQVLEVSNRNGRYTTELHRWFLPEQPAAIAIDQVKRLLFVSVTGEHPGIFSMHLDGTELRLLVDTDLISPLSLATDPEHGYLFWADAGSGKIERVRIDGKRKRVLHIHDGHPSSIAVDHTWIYWTDPHSGSLYWMDKVSSLDVHHMTLHETVGKHPSDYMRVLALTRPTITVESACLTRNGGCSHICVSKSGGTVCLCPAGLALDKDGKTCMSVQTCTNLQFSCDDSTCISKAWVCDGSNDCLTGEDEHRCDFMTHDKQKISCPNEKFGCDGNMCLSPTKICDGRGDCKDGTDEQNCKGSLCGSDPFYCDNGKCISRWWLCDHDEDCEDGSDETGCVDRICRSGEIRCMSGQCVQQQFVCDGDIDCSDASDESNCTKAVVVQQCYSTEFICGDGVCIDATMVCDGDNDCTDNSDELNCNTSTVSSHLDLRADCPRGMFLCEGQFKCIPTKQLCDGEINCQHGDDERDCVRKCNKEQFECGDKTCISKSWVCDEDADCADGSDEMQSCSTVTTPSTVAPLKVAKNPTGCAMDQYECRDGSCIQLSRVCDRIPHCPDSSDEAESCDLACRVGNGGCSDICVATPYGARCSCHKGMKLLPNGAQCIDIDECTEHTPCSHFCRNHRGYYVCFCEDGYQLRPDGHTCHANGPAPAIFLTMSDNIQSLTMDGHHLRQHYRAQPGEAINTAVVDAFSQDIYLSFQGDRGLYRYSKGQNEVFSITESEDVIRESPGLMVLDWIAGNLYTWSAASLPSSGGVVHVCALHSSGCSELMTTESSDVSSIVVDPRLGVMLYSVWSHNVNVAHGKIMRSSLDGQFQRVLVDTKLVRPTALCLDFVHGRVYWADLHLRRIESALTDGSERSEVVREGLKYIVALSIFEDTLYWADTGSGVLSSCRLPACKNVTSVYHIGYKLHDMTVLHVSRRPAGRDPCSTSRRRCGHICVPTSRGHQCLCPYGYNATDYTNTTCIPPRVERYDDHPNDINHIDGISPAHHGQSLNECDDDFCMNGGTCTVVDEQVLCECPGGFGGGRCELKQSSGGWVAAVILVGVFSLTLISLGLYCYRTERIGKSDRPSPLKYSNPLLDLPILNRLRFNPYRRTVDEQDPPHEPRLRSYSNPLFGTEQNSDVESPFMGGKVEFHVSGSQVSIDSALLSEQSSSSSPTTSSSR